MWRIFFLENIKNHQNTSELETSMSNNANKFTVNALICCFFNVCINFRAMFAPAGSSAQHRRRVTGLFSWWTLSLWGGGSCPKDQPCGDPGPLWPLWRNPQTSTEHHQCQVVCWKSTRGQSVPICYMTACVHFKGLCLDLTLQVQLGQYVFQQWQNVCHFACKPNHIVFKMKIWRCDWSVDSTFNLWSLKKNIASTFYPPFFFIDPGFGMAQK